MEQKNPLIEKISEFIDSHWKPEWSVVRLGSGQFSASPSLLGNSITQKELVDNVLFPLTVTHAITPNEATTRFQIITNKLLFEFLGIDLVNMEQKLTPEIQEEFLNKLTMQKLIEYDMKHTTQSAKQWFIKELTSFKRPDIIPILAQLAKQHWGPFVYNDPETKKFKVSYTVGDIIGNMVYFCNMSHKEAVDRFNAACRYMEKELNFDVEQHYIKRVAEVGVTKYGIRNLQADFQFFLNTYALSLMTEDYQHSQWALNDRAYLSNEHNPLVKTFGTVLFTMEDNLKLIE